MTFSNDCIQDVGRCAAQIPVLTVTQDTQNSLNVTLYSQTESAVDLTRYSQSSSSSSGSSDSFTGVQFKVKALYTDQNPYLSTEVTVTDPSAGIIRWDYTPTDLEKCGMWLAVFNLVYEGVKEASIPYYLDIRPNLSNYYAHGPVTIPEIRIAMRDCAGANTLLDDVEFSAEEIAWSIRRPIDFWNDALPPVAPHTVATFPFRYQWLNATMGELLLIAARHYERNRLSYNAAGVSVADKDKGPQYYQAGKQLLAEWQDWVKNKKISINVSGSYGTLRSYYPGSGYYYETSGDA